ncbi:MAG: DUF4919 domain-containing protein [Bacteroidales bacterium]|jgi:tetratricopeptide (TPR) repeat protein|nr:DUF4919 domain-containing protein [Bacteroidales bacterium]
MKIAKIIFLKVILFITASINLFSQTAEEWKKLGNIELESANYVKAIEYYQKAIEADSTYFDAYYNLGAAFSNIQEFEKAIDFYSKAIDINDTIADTYFSLGTVYADQNEYEKAIKLFKQGINLKPDSPNEHYFLSFLYQKKGNNIYSTLYFKKAAQLGDALAQQYFIDNEISWEDNFVKPDYDQIKLNIENKQSNFHYSKLWDRFQQGDSTMTLEEKRHLYYGYVFNKSYSPYVAADNSKQVNAILEKKNPKQKEWKKLASLLNTSLETEPFNVRYLYYQYVAYNFINESVNAEKNLQKIWTIIDALNSTGDGLLKGTAIHVIAVSSEYDYLFFNDLSSRGQALMSGGYDVLYLYPNENELEEMWFDVNQPLNYIYKSFK